MRGTPTTPSEKYLQKLCEHTFFSLWSYPAVYKDQGRKGGKGHGREVCDLLVVFGDRLIVFSDKFCQFPDIDDVGLAWSRWFRRAVVESAKQAWRAAGWIKKNPRNLFLDRACTHPFPIPLDVSETKIHLVAVAQGIAPTIRNDFGGSGSLMINTTLAGVEAHTGPFRVGDLDPSKPFVHVLDDESLDLLMENRDTVADFIGYLEKREELMRGERPVFSAGEEELLSIYLTKLNADGDHDFVFPESASGKAVLVDEGGWRNLQASPQRKAQLSEDRISYVWDELIKKFAENTLSASQEFVSDGGLSDSERILRMMASQPRYKRRQYSREMITALETTAADQRRIKVLFPAEPGDPYFLLLLLPPASGATGSYESYREMRRDQLAMSCLVLRLLRSDARDIVGIATEAGFGNEGRSEDLLYLDGRYWDETLAEQARGFQKNHGILVDPSFRETVLQEWPDPEEA